MPLLFNYLKIPDWFIGWNASFAISVNLTNDCDGNQLNYNNDLPAIRNKSYALQKPLDTDFLTVIGNAKLRQNSAQITRFCTLTYFFYVKLFATIILSLNLLKCIC